MGGGGGAKHMRSLHDCFCPQLKCIVTTYAPFESSNQCMQWPFGMQGYNSNEDISIDMPD